MAGELELFKGSPPELIRKLNRLVQEVESLRSRGMDEEVELVNTPFGTAAGGSHRRRLKANSRVLVIPVHVILDGGQPGDSTQDCTFTYSIWRLGEDFSYDEKKVAAQVAAYYKRLPKLKYIPALEGDIAQAIWLQATQTWWLWHNPREVPVVHACE